MKLFLETRDFSVSGEEFKLLYDQELDMLVTDPQPEKLDAYYQSSSYISHTDSNETFTDKLYQGVKRFSLWTKVLLINTYAKGEKTVLDVGAGTGDFLLKARDMGWSVAGVEPNIDARLRSREKKMELLPSLDALPEKRYKVITLWHVLEHLPDLEAQIAKLKSLLDDDGVLVVAVPNFKSFDAKHYGRFWAAYDVPRHLWHFSATAVEKVFAKQGMRLVKRKPMWFDSFYVSLLSEKYRSGKSNFLKAFYVGLRSNLMALLTREFSSAIYIIKKGG
ncbi:class I SAM-dependent methyltransferase [Pseudozobellia thermophila]|uniref:2-polyprenyl-3-methyl-5-hydroxy-6-metoxy-1,4-benzoquinol methylase n=1 Tax=Pseudozobellia thermophila TaxID=192903 RepID=A0A1M6BJR3_9FLAO|nr:class I SAM-dependent methyltransferase [Pseudozobellia thermophila]SHI48926.1 2-polyprenyl-3-methyl-5-hydroxy-6-metoxy-1,4-benzoquinol methylase [Pseudozobellia thermophila]